MLTVREGFYDEVFDARRDAARRTRQRSAAALEALGPEALAAAGRRRDAIFMQQGITFDAGGAGRRRAGARPPVPARPRAADHPRRRVDARSSAGSRSASAR